MTKSEVIAFAAIPPAITLPASITLHPAVHVTDVAEYISTAITRLHSECPLLRQLAQEALDRVVAEITVT